MDKAFELQQREGQRHRMIYTPSFLFSPFMTNSSLSSTIGLCKINAAETRTGIKCAYRGEREILKILRVQNMVLNLLRYHHSDN